MSWSAPSVGSRMAGASQPLYDKAARNFLSAVRLVSAITNWAQVGRAPNNHLKFS
jgi:hypothetical protein